MKTILTLLNSQSFEIMLSLAENVRLRLHIRKEKFSLGIKLNNLKFARSANRRSLKRGMGDITRYIEEECEEGLMVRIIDFIVLTHVRIFIHLLISECNGICAEEPKQPEPAGHQDRGKRGSLGNSVPRGTTPHLGV